MQIDEEQAQKISTVQEAADAIAANIKVRRARAVATCHSTAAAAG